MKFLGLNSPGNFFNFSYYSYNFRTKKNRKGWFLFQRLLKFLLSKEEEVEEKSEEPEVVEVKEESIESKSEEPESVEAKEEEAEVKSEEPEVLKLKRRSQVEVKIRGTRNQNEVEKKRNRSQSQRNQNQLKPRKGRVKSESGEKLEEEK